MNMVYIYIRVRIITHDPTDLGVALTLMSPPVKDTIVRVPGSMKSPEPGSTVALLVLLTES